MSQEDIDVYPPVDPLIQAYAIGPAAGVVTIPLIAFGTDGYFWFSFIADVDWWVKFGASAGVIVDPVPAAVTPAAGVALRVPANFELQRKLHQGYGTLKVAASIDGILYLQLASHPGAGGF